MSGALLVSGGTLNVTGTFTGNSTATVQSSATLAGTGTVQTLTLQSGSFLAPGNATISGSIGTLTATQSGANTTIWNPGATARFHLSTTDTTSDRLAVTTLTKGTTGSGGFLFDFQNTGTASQTYTLATFTSSPGFVVGDFTATNLAPGLRGFFTLTTGVSLTFTTYASTAVTNTNDTGTGSLRQAVLNAASNPGADTIVFPSTLSGPITLSSQIVLGSSVTLDASSVPGGVTISGNNATRIFTVNSGQTVELKNLTLTGGRTTASGGTNNGGSIFSNGTLTLTRCTLFNNTAAAAEGGAIANTNVGTLALVQCTLTGNSCGGGSGGAIHNNGILALTHCTVSSNNASLFAGGIYRGGTSVTLANSIVAGNLGNNSPLDGADLRGPTTITYIGANIVQSVAGTGGVSGPAATNAAPLLAPLGNYGGPTQTVALLPGSPARNAAVGSTATSDQRGFPVIGTPDIGAYEAGTLTDFDAWAYETLPASATLAQHAPTFDLDGDGRTNLLEYAALSAGDVPNGGTPLALTRNPAGTEATVSFPTRFNAPDIRYTIERSTALTGLWTTVFTYNGATNGFTTIAGVSVGFTATDTTLYDNFVAGQARVFYRLKVTLQ